MIEDLPGYWTQYRWEFMWKEGVTEAVTISRTFREGHDKQPAGVEEELACECDLGDEVRYFYMKVHWYVLPIPGSRGRLHWSGRQALTKEEYEAWRQMRAVEDQTWWIVCSCGWTRQAESQWAAKSASRLHSHLADPTMEHETRIEPGGHGDPQEWPLSENTPDRWRFTSGQR